MTYCLFYLITQSVS